jgi:hypothetical protein
MISSFLKSSKVSSGVARTAESNAHRTNHDVRFMLLPLVTLPILTEWITLSRIERCMSAVGEADSFLQANSFNAANQSAPL